MSNLSIHDSRAKGREEGFTLLELLVAMTVLSLVGLVMLGGLRFGTSAWERAQSTADDADAIEAAQNMLRQELSSIYPEWINDTNGGGHVAFTGNGQSISFIAPPPVQLGPGSHLRFDLHLAERGNLELAWRPAGRLGSETDNQSATLLHRISSIDVAYFGPDATGQNPTWWDHWTERTKLPQLVRIRISFFPGDRQIWPELIVHPETTVDVSCIYDAISQGCRGRPG